MPTALLCAAAATLMAALDGAAADRCLPSSARLSTAPPASGRPVVFEMDNWETQTLVTHAAMILLRDTLGLNVTHKVHPGGSSLYGRAAKGGANGTCATCGDGVDANMEVWPNTKQAARAQWMCTSGACGTASVSERDCVHETKHTATGQSSMFVKVRDPVAMAADVVNFWRSYKTER